MCCEYANIQALTVRMHFVHLSLELHKSVVYIHAFTCVRNTYVCRFKFADWRLLKFVLLCAAVMSMLLPAVTCEACGCREGGGLVQPLLGKSRFHTWRPKRGTNPLQVLFCLEVNPSGVAIGCARRASLWGLFRRTLCGEEGSFWNPCTQACSNLATPLVNPLQEGHTPPFVTSRKCSRGGVSLNPLYLPCCMRVLSMCVVCT